MVCVLLVVFHTKMILMSLLLLIEMSEFYFNPFVSSLTYLLYQSGKATAEK